MVLDGELESFLLVLNSWIGILQCLQYHILLNCSRSQQLQDSQVFKGDGIHKALAGRSEAGPDLISMILVPSSLVGVSVAVLQLLQSGLSVD